MKEVLLMQLHDYDFTLLRVYFTIYHFFYHHIWSHLYFVDIFYL